MSKIMTTNKHFEKLVADLQKILAEGKKRAAEAVVGIFAETYWQAGKRITEDAHVKIDPNSLDSPNVSELSRRLGIERSLVSRMMKMFTFWPKGVPTMPNGHNEHILSWSHYKILIAVEDKKEREFYTDEALKNDWSRSVLQQKIKDNYYDSVKTSSAFKRKPKKRPQLTRKIDKLYLYSSEVKKVVDGDTLRLMVDLGFEVWKDQRFRLRGIDCPKKSTPEGQRATAFVQEQLKNCPRIVVQTTKMIDLHGRYVVDVFYLEDERSREFIATKGKFLNQELLDQGLATLL